MIRSIRWRLIIGGLIAICLPLFAFVVVIASLLWRFYLQRTERELDTQARMIADVLAPTLAAPRSSSLPAVLDPEGVVTRRRRYASSRVTIADADGVILASSLGRGLGTPVDDSRHPGLRDALRGHDNATVWKSPNFAFEDTMYVNVPVRYGGRVVGAVRVAHSLAEIQRDVGRVRSTLAGLIVAYALVLGALLAVLAQGIVRPIEALRRDALRVAGGDLAHRVQIAGRDEIAQLAATLNQMTVRLQTLEGLRRQYVSDVSHELRTPLTAIRSMTETVLQYGESDPALRARYLPRILGQTDRLARLATQLLDLAQIESGNLVGDFAPVALGEVLDEVVQTHAPRALALGVELTTSVPSALPSVRGDRDRLMQVFVNLVDNALRYTPPGGRVTLAARAEADHVEASVEDTGRGIPPEHVPHLFERFYRAESARTARSGGAGLGLSIAQQIVAVHGGVIAVTSEPGVGTRFRVDLPRTENARGTSLAPPPPSQESPS